MKPHTEIMLRTIASNCDRLMGHVDLLIEDEPEIERLIDVEDLFRTLRQIVSLARQHGYIGDLDPMTAAMRGPEQIRDVLELDG